MCVPYEVTLSFICDWSYCFNRRQCSRPSHTLSTWSPTSLSLTSLPWMCRKLRLNLRGMKWGRQKTNQFICRDFSRTDGRWRFAGGGIRATLLFNLRRFFHAVDFGLYSRIICLLLLIGQRRSVFSLNWGLVLRQLFVYDRVHYS